MKLDIFVIAGLLCCLLCQCARHYDQKEAERYIVASERQWAESVATGDPSTVERILADDFLGVDPKGTLYDKAKMIADTRNAPQVFAFPITLMKSKSGFTATPQSHKAMSLGNGSRASVDALYGPILGFDGMDAGKS
jgi:hypothetical protein